MNALFALTLANIKSYVRDRAALFWTLAFPLIFIFMFGFIFQGGGGGGLTLGWVDADGSPAATQLRDAFKASAGHRAHRRRPRTTRSPRCATARSMPSSSSRPATASRSRPGPPGPGRRRR